MGRYVESLGKNCQETELASFAVTRGSSMMRGAALFAGILSSLKSSPPDTKCLPVRAATGGLLHWIGGSEKPISEEIVSNLKIV